MARKKFTKTNPDDPNYVAHTEDSKGQAVSINTILLGIILLLVVIQTFMMFTDDNDAVVASTGQPATNVTTPSSGLADQMNIQNANQPQQQAQNNILNPSAAPSGAIASYAESSKDFGSVKANQKLRHSFKFTNTGTAPLTYGDVTGDEGVTIISKPTGTIEPGGTGEIVVELNTAGLSGQVSKMVHVNANTEPAHVHLTVGANVN